MGAVDDRLRLVAAPDVVVGARSASRGQRDRAVGRVIAPYEVERVGRWRQPGRKVATLGGLTLAYQATGSTGHSYAFRVRAIDGRGAHRRRGDLVVDRAARPEPVGRRGALCPDLVRATRPSASIGGSTRADQGRGRLGDAHLQRPSVAWVGPRGHGRGKVKVYIDGGYVGHRQPVGQRLPQPPGPLHAHLRLGRHPYPEARQQGHRRSSASGDRRLHRVAVSAASRASASALALSPRRSSARRARQARSRPPTSRPRTVAITRTTRWSPRSTAVEARPIPTSSASSASARPTKAARSGRPRSATTWPTDEAEPEVLFDGLHHAREHVTLEQTIDLLHFLVDGYGTRPARDRCRRQPRDLHHLRAQPGRRAVRPDRRSLSRMAQEPPADARLVEGRHRPQPQLRLPLGLLWRLDRAARAASRIAAGSPSRHPRRAPCATSWTAA